MIRSQSRVPTIVIACSAFVVQCTSPSSPEQLDEERGDDLIVLDEEHVGVPTAAEAFLSHGGSHTERVPAGSVRAS